MAAYANSPSFVLKSRLRQQRFLGHGEQKVPAQQIPILVVGSHLPTLGFQGPSLATHQFKVKNIHHSALPTLRFAPPRGHRHFKIKSLGHRPHSVPRRGLGPVNY